MSSDAEAASHGGFTLFPLRRALVPCHVRFDKTSLHDTLTSLRNEENGGRGDASSGNKFQVTANYSFTQ
jgi:hypothetical protein